MMLVRDLVWLAGLLEGEGCFSVVNKGSRRCISVWLRMTDRDVVERAMHISGVGTGVYAQPQPTKKTVYVWTVTQQRDAAALMMTLYPLMGKRRQEKIRECLSVWRNYVGRAAA